jgi:hypothetical protein
MLAAAEAFVTQDDRSQWNGAAFREARSVLDPWLVAVDDFLMESRDHPKISDLDSCRSA